MAENIKPYSPERPEPSIGLLPSGRSPLAPIIRGYGLEGDSVEDLESEYKPEGEAKPAVVEDPGYLYYICEKTSDELVEAEMEQACG